MRRLGFEVEARNYKTRRGEVDLVLRNGGDLVFVEAKLRRGTGFGHPLETVSQRQRRRVHAAAEEWIHENEPRFETVRFDVIGILVRREHREILHVEDAL
jgi:putative endonuclease